MSVFDLIFTIISFPSFTRGHWRMTSIRRAPGKRRDLADLRNLEVDLENCGRRRSLVSPKDLEAALDNWGRREAATMRRDVTPVGGEVPNFNGGNKENESGKSEKRKSETAEVSSKFQKKEPIWWGGGWVAKILGAAE